MQIVESISIVLEGAPNFRDLGGYPTKDGRVVRSGQVFRSGHLARLTDEDVALLEAAGVRTVVDFRSDIGVEIFGNDRLPAGSRHVAIPIGSGEADPAMRAAMEAGRFSQLPDLATANRILIREYAPEYGRLITLIGDVDNLPLVFHCIGGKDRTGIAAALLLSILGVPWSIVRNDYLASNAYFGASLEARLIQLAERPGGSHDASDLDAARRFFIVEGGDIDAALDEIRIVAGSIAAFVTEKMGVPETAVRRIRDHLLVKDGLS